MVRTTPKGGKIRMRRMMQMLLQSLDMVRAESWKLGGDGGWREGRKPRMEAMKSSLSFFLFDSTCSQRAMYPEGEFHQMAGWDCKRETHARASTTDETT